MWLLCIKVLLLLPSVNKDGLINQCSLKKLSDFLSFSHLFLNFLHLNSVFLYWSAWQQLGSLPPTMPSQRSLLLSLARNLINLICTHPFSRISSVKQDEQEIDSTASRSRRKTKLMCLLEDVKTLCLLSLGWSSKNIWLGAWKTYFTQIAACPYAQAFIHVSEDWSVDADSWMFGHTGAWRLPVVLGPPANLFVVVVLLLQPINKRFEVLHEWLGSHFGLARDHSHSLWPGLAEAQLHHITADVNTGQRGGSEETGISRKSVF